MNLVKLSAFYILYLCIPSLDAFETLSRFSQINAGSVSFTEVIKSFTARFASVCLFQCKQTVYNFKDCTHAVIEDLGQERVNCTLLNADD